jgi:hypothetical protein
MLNSHLRAPSQAAQVGKLQETAKFDHGIDNFEEGVLYCTSTKLSKVGVLSSSN